MINTLQEGHINYKKLISIQYISKKYFTEARWSADLQEHKYFTNTKDKTKRMDFACKNIKDYLMKKM